MVVNTCFIIDLIRERKNRITGPATMKLAELGETSLQLPVFVLCELHAGANLSHHPEKERRRVALLAELMEVRYPEPSFPIMYGESEAFLRRKGTPIATMDLLIGIMAKGLGLPLLTRNAKHFQAIPGLTVERY